MPPVSRSGLIRSATGPAKAKLATNLTDGEKCTSKKIPEVAKDGQDEIILLDDIVPRVKANISTLMERDAQWQTLVGQLTTEEEVALEQQLYERVALADGTGDEPEGYLHIVERAKEWVNVAEARVKELRQRVDRIPSKNSDIKKRLTIAKLPKLALPKFCGDPLLWDEFWSIFRSNVHETSLTNIEKFSYLRGTLYGTAQDVIEGIAITDDNYETAVSLLEDRFKRPAGHLIGLLYHQLKKIPTSSNRVSELVHTYDACERIFRQLENIGEKLDNNRSLTLDVLSKYPPAVITELFQRWEVSTESELVKLRKAIQSYLRQSENVSEMLENLEPFTNTGPVKSSKTRANEAKVTTDLESVPELKPNYPTSTFAVTQPKRGVDTNSDKNSSASNSYGRREPSRQNPCYFCGGSHFNSECESYPSAEERVERLKVTKRCFRCMNGSHMRFNCRVQVRCYFCKAVGQHCSPLCPKHFPTKEKRNDEASLAITEQPEQPPSADTTTCLSVDQKTILSTAWTTVQNPITGQGKQVRIFFDNGSHRSFITEHCASELKLPVLSDDVLNIAVFGTQRTLSVQSKRVEFKVLQKDGSTKTISAHTTPLITNCSLHPGKLPVEETLLFKSMKDEMADNWQEHKDSTIDILIGSDFFWDFLMDSRLKTPSGLHLLKSTVGYLVSGKLDQPIDEFPEDSPPVLLCALEVTQQHVWSPTLSTHQSVTRATYGKVPDVDQFWDLETIGITDDPQSKDDDEALQLFNDTIEYKDGRYHVTWPWRKSNIYLPSNFELASGRFRSLAKRLKTSPAWIRQQYQHVIDDQLRKGIIEMVDDNDSCEPNDLIHYLPHHPVVKPESSTTKLRMVCDASAKTSRHSVSLNECLYRGPVLLPNLCSILLRFRLWYIAMIADIEKAFLQVGLQKSQRDVTRFLWFKDCNSVEVEDNTITFRFCRVPFGIISSPFLLGATVQHHLKSNPSPVAENIRNNIYVDNIITGVSTEEEAKCFYTEAKDLFRRSGMNLQEWYSNSQEVVDFIPVGDHIKRPEKIKVLGIRWDQHDDTLQLPECAEMHKACKTKREILQTVASIYDPLGLFQPVLLNAKLFLHRLWKDKKEWDEPIDEQLREDWSKIYQDVVPIFEVRIPRCISKQCDQVTVLLFSDASANAYGATVYLRVWNQEQKSWSTNLAFCKTRLTPKSKSRSIITLPRLELLGLTVGARAADFVRKSLPPSMINITTVRIVMFCDSLCVLHWIRSSKVMSVFVENRLAEIRKIANTEFRYVATHDNPADICTRGKSAKELANCNMWWKGPDWLTLPKDQWPAQPLSDIEQPSDSTIQLIESETRKSQPKAECSNVAGEGPTDDVGPLGIKATDYSTLDKVLRVTVKCLKFLKKILWSKWSDDKKRSKPVLDSLMQSISDDKTWTTKDELSSARKIWIQHEQRQGYASVISAIEKGQKNMLVQQLGLRIDEEGFIRCYGRYEHADLPYDAAQPSLLPKDSYITELIIRDAHERAFHAGISHTLSQVRRSVWIPQGRNTVRKILNRCNVCRRHKGPPFALPKMPPWPKERLSRSSPFRFTGLDYFGPVNVKIEEEIHKIWICLFTCLAVRAIHLEWVKDCSARQFLDCVIRFISRRGTPEQIISDNAPQFRVTKSAFDRIWHEVIVDPSVQSYAAQHGITWKFTTQLAPWQGGFYERLVGIVKTAFKTAVGRRLLRFDEFVTLSTEVEAVVNSRPLTYVYSDLGSGLALRPIDFLTDLPVGLPVTNNKISTQQLGDAGKDLIAHWKHHQYRLEILWKTWYDEYLLSLRERFQLQHRGRRSEVHVPPKVDDVVIVKDTNTPRGNWKLARVVRLISSSDNEVRSAEIRLPNKLLIRRPLNLLYPMEVDNSNHDLADTNFDGFHDNELEHSKEVSAARRALLQRLTDVAATIMFP